VILYVPILLIAVQYGADAPSVELQAPAAGARFDAAEFVVRVSRPWFDNPFTDVELTGTFKVENSSSIVVRGFADAQDGGVFRLRFCPERAGQTYSWELDLRAGEVKKQWTGTFKCEPSTRGGPVVVDPRHPKHFMFAGSGRNFYHLGYTAYHLLDSSNSDEHIASFIDYYRREEFNKVRFLLTGYPRDPGKQAARDDKEFGVADPWSAANYGSKPDSVHPLPAWLGEPHHYDFTRFNVAYWQKVDRMVRRMRDAGIVATCIFTIEKQNLPKEYGALTDAEYRLYRYGVARLAAFDNVWWDLGNEHNEYRDVHWGNTMGAFVKQEDPYGRLASAHAYSDFLYPKSKWADFIITQQYGDEKSVYDWVLTYREIPKPYVNEEYGYEGHGERNRRGLVNVGHGQDADHARRSHWSIAMAGGYATYGDWSDGIAHYYMGEPGPGKAAAQLKHLRRFFEAIPFAELEPASELVSEGFCLARVPDCYVLYLPHGGESRIDLSKARSPLLVARWFDPRTGHWQPGPPVSPEKTTITAPSADDWVLQISGGEPSSQSAP